MGCINKKELDKFKELSDVASEKSNEPITMYDIIESYHSVKDNTGDIDLEEDNGLIIDLAIAQKRLEKKGKDIILEE